MWNIMRSFGVYIHIPFCIQKCAYCDFLSKPATRQRQQAYVEALKREIAGEAVRYKGYRVGTLFFGGGTPSILEAADIEGLLDCLRKYYIIDGGTDTEITLEMNPKTADKSKLLRLKDLGINRLSIGLQSADNAQLKLLGRIHTYEDFVQTYSQAREAGFENINVDLMSALPGQNMESWIDTLEKAAALQPEHISAYSLIIEEGTRMHERLEEYPSMPDEETDRQMYQMTKQILAQKGYRRYEISNYAKRGYECRHNRIYWQRGAEHTADYVGFGLGASSTFGNVRWKNTDDMEKYLRFFTEHDIFDKDRQSGTKRGAAESVKEEIQELSRNDCMEEFMFLGLRMTNGVSKSEFAKSFGDEADKIYKDVLLKWTQQGMLVQDGDRIRLTDAGIDVSNVVLADFLL